jgi:molecular chaperone DnaJ
VATPVKTDYYELLGVERNADVETIKKAFHAQARDCHPDVSEVEGAEERFREIAEAYTVLSRRESRLLYDRFGYRGRGNRGFDEAVWEARPRVQRGENVNLELGLEPYEAELGAKPIVMYEAFAQCESCDGDGLIGAPDPSCEICEGTGHSRLVSDLDLVRLLQLEPCPDCGAETCPDCDGAGRLLVQRRLRLRVPPHVEEGVQLRVGGEGHAGLPGAIPGDLLVDVYVRPAPRDRVYLQFTAFALLIVTIVILVLYLR